MNLILDFTNDPEEGLVSWHFAGKSVVKKYDGRALATKLMNDEGVIVVYFQEGMGQDNAIIFNPDGTERCRIKNPCKDKGAICFEDVYYVRNELTLIIAFKSYQYACVVDPEGKIKRLYETR